MIASAQPDVTRRLTRPAEPTIGVSWGVVTAHFYESWDFYTELLGFHTVAEWDTTVRLRHPSGAELELLAHEVDGHPAELISATDGRGIWLTLEVDDVGQMYSQLRDAGVTGLEPLEDRRDGRQGRLRDPNGIVIVLREPYRTLATSAS